MTTFDFSPLFRTSVGYDRLASMLNSAHRPERIESPPCEIVRGANAARYERSPSVRLKDIFEKALFFQFSHA